MERTEAESVSVQTKIETAEEGETDVRREEWSDMEKEQRSNTRKGEKNSELLVLLGRDSTVC